MKKLILAALAASVVSAPAMAQPFNHYGQGYGRQQTRTVHVDTSRNRYQQQQQRNWRQGERFDSRYARNYREIRDPRAYHLREAPRGYRWVQSGDDAVLVAIAGGVIGAVLANLFN